MQPKYVSLIVLILFFIIVLLPIITIFVASITSEQGLTFKYYQVLLSEHRQVKLLFNSIILALGTTFFSVIIGSSLAFLIKRSDVYFGKYFAYLYLVPILIPPYINAIAWIDLFGPQGKINLFFMKLFSLNAPVFNIYTFGGAIFILTLYYFPFVCLLTISGLSSIDQRLEEAASLIHSRFNTLRKITLPLLIPYVLSGAIFVFIFVITNYSVPALLRINTYPLEIFVQFSAFYNIKAAVAASSMFIFPTMLLVLLQAYVMGNRSYLTLRGAVTGHKIYKLGAWNTLAFIYVCLIIFIAAFLPVGILIQRSQSLLSYKIALLGSYREILLSLGLAGISATIIIVMSFFIAYIIERTSPRRRIILNSLTFLPFAISATVLGIGLIQLWNRPATQFIYGSFLIIIIGYIARFIPFAIRAICANLKQIDKSLEEAAIISRISWPKRLFKLLLPLTQKGIFAGWIIVFILCIGELGTTLLIIPAGKITLPLKIYTLMHYGAGKLVASLSVILVIITLSVVLMVSGIGKGVRAFVRTQKY
ncbi:MAG: iron ABC transporter permease [Candidatus Omnitrophota bacterium]